MTYEREKQREREKQSERERNEEEARIESCSRLSLSRGEKISLWASARMLRTRRKHQARKKKESIVSFSLSLSLSLFSRQAMENHLLRHGEAMEAELKAMGAVQLGVREEELEKRRERERR
jgi:hypothetical protein